MNGPYAVFQKLRPVLWRVLVLNITQWVAKPDLGPQIGNAAAQPESQSM